MDPSKQRAMFYAIVILLGFAYFGNISEQCSYAHTCPDRAAAVIAMGVLTVLLTTASLVICLLTLPKIIELILDAIAIVTNLAACAIAMSPKTFRDVPIVITWTAQIFLVIVIFKLLFDEDDTPLLPVKTKAATTSDHAVAVPLKEQQQQQSVPPPPQTVPTVPAPVQYAPAPQQVTTA